MRLLTFLLGKHHGKPPVTEVVTPHSTPLTATDTSSKTTLSDDDLLHLAYPFYLLSRVPLR